MAFPAALAGWPKPLRIALLAAAGLLVLLVVVVALAWTLMPREWIQEEARRQAARMSSAKVAWTRITPAFQDWSLGVTVEKLDLRMPETGPPRLQARLPEAFVSFKLFPLLFRRVEVDGARIRGGGIVLTDQGPTPPSPGESKGGGMNLYLPRVDLDGVSIRTRDPLGAGYDLKRVSGKAEIQGALDHPAAVRLQATADSLYWKPEARSPLLPLPSPATAKIVLQGQSGGQRLVVTEGSATVGPLESAISGEIRLPPAPQPAQLALRIVGQPQTIRSSDPALRAFTSKSPASFSATVSWDVRVGGTARDLTNEGRLLLKPFSVSAESNTFTMDQASVSWSSAADQKFVGRAEGFGGGITFTAEARGVTTPGGEIRGTFYSRVPAERLNGLTENGPMWNSGDLECRGTFVSHPPAELGLEYTVTGTGFSGTMPSVSRPIRRLTFAVAGNQKTATIQSLEAVVGSTTANVTGQVTLGPVKSGTFDVKVDRLVADEWTGGAGTGVRLDAVEAADAAKSKPPLSSVVATMRIGELRNRGLVVHDVVAPVRFAQGKLVADPIVGKIGSGSVQGALDVTGVGAKPAFTLHLDLSQVPVEDVIAGLLPVRLPLSGALTDVIDLRGSGYPGPEAAATMTGTVAGKIERGLFRQSAALKQLRETLGGESPSEVAFQTLTHSARIQGGKLMLDKVSGDLGKDLFSITGAVGFDQTLDLNALLRLAPGRVTGSTFLAQLASYGKDAEGRVPIEVKITGNALSPKVTVQPARFIESAGAGFVKEEVGKLLGGNNPARPGGALADSAAHRPDSTAAHPRAARDSLATTVKGALRKLFGK
ncbi:MAG: AsmA-like C-terminal region-containing protein [Bacteroidota bacterium]